jgi:hypothetical protein
LSWLQDLLLLLPLLLLLGQVLLQWWRLLAAEVWRQLAHVTNGL